MAFACWPSKISAPVKERSAYIECCQEDVDCSTLIRSKALFVLVSGTVCSAPLHICLQKKSNSFAFKLSCPSFIMFAEGRTKISHKCV